MQSITTVATLTFIFALFITPVTFDLSHQGKTTQVNFVAIDITVALAAEEPGGGGDGDGGGFFAAIGNFFEAIGRALGGLFSGGETAGNGDSNEITIDYYMGTKATIRSTGPPPSSGYISIGQKVVAGLTYDLYEFNGPLGSHRPGPRGTPITGPDGFIAVAVETDGGDEVDQIGTISFGAGCNLSAIPDPVILGESVTVTWDYLASGSSTVVWQRFGSVANENDEPPLVDNALTEQSVSPSEDTSYKYQAVINGPFYFDDYGNLMNGDLTVVCDTEVTIGGLGCTDPVAINYDPSAVTDDGSCIFDPGTPWCHAVISTVDTGTETKFYNNPNISHIVMTSADDALPALGTYADTTVFRRTHPTTYSHHDFSLFVNRTDSYVSSRNFPYSRNYNWHNITNEISYIQTAASAFGIPMTMSYYRNQADPACALDTPSISGLGCEINEGESTCPGTLNWNGSMLIIPQVFNVRSDSVVSTSLTGNNQTVTLQGGANLFSLLDNGISQISVILYASCETDTNWNGSVCTASGGSGAPTISATNCTIGAGNNTCLASLTWNGSSLTNPVVYQTRQGTDFSTNPTGTNRTVTLMHGNNLIWLKDLEVNEVSANPTASCIGNAGLVGGVCPAACTTLDIEASASLVRHGDEVTITWETCPSAPADCTLSSNLSASPSDGSEVVTMTSSSLFTLDCPGGGTPDAEVEVRVLPRIYES